MKQIFSTLFLVLFALAGKCQQLSFPDGVYLSLEQLKNLTPAYNVNLRIIRRTQRDIGFNGGNDYELVSDVDSLDKKYIKKKIYAYAKHDSLFLNGFQHELGTWYALCLTKGNFLAFKGCMTNKQAASEVSSFGLLGGAIGGGIAGASIAKKRFLYSFSIRTGNVRLLDKAYIVDRLNENQALLDQFKLEKDQQSDSILVQYISKLNDVVSVHSAPPPTPSPQK